VEEPEVRFPRQLVQWAQEWLRANEAQLESAEAKRPFVILFSLAPALDAERWERANPTPIARQRYYKNAYDIPPSGLLYATANFNEMVAVGAPFTSGSAALDCVLAPEFHSLLYAIVFPHQRSVAFHLPGDQTADFAKVEVRQKLGGYSIENLSIEVLDELLKMFHRQVVETSSCYAGVSLWQQPFANRKLVREAEKVIQGHLATFLCGKFDATGIHMDWEVYTGGGRADVRLLRWPKTTNEFTAAYLELKVVRNKPQNAMQLWVNDGIFQAYDYMKKGNPPSGLGLACCYNNHDNGTAIRATAQPIADEKKVHLRFYDIHHLPPHAIKSGHTGA
jgi:hypothetical protein